MFILTVGIVSVLSLFTAGREIQARTAVVSRAISFADQVAATVEPWRKLTEWQARDVDANASFLWADAMGATVRLPVIIDPYSLNRNTPQENPTGWDWRNFADTRVSTGGPATAPPQVNQNWSQYFRRITLPSVPRSEIPDGPPGDNTLTFEEVIALLGDADAVEYSLPTDLRKPAENQFEFGRRKRGGDLSPALMIARQDWKSDPPTTAVPMRYWLLISHKQSRNYDFPAEPSADDTQWPQGCVRFDVVSAENGLLDLTLPQAKRPRDPASLRRGLQPGRWLMLARWQGAGWIVHWTKMTSVTGNGAARWLVVPASPPAPEADWQYSTPNTAPNTFAPVAFTFDSLIHVQELPTLAGTELF